MKLKKFVAMSMLTAMLSFQSAVAVQAEDNTVTQAADATTQVSSSTETMQGSISVTDDVTVKSTADKSTKAKKKSHSGKTSNYTKKELRYMAAIIYCEAGNQSYAGKLAVGIVVKNRMESKTFPDTIKGVLYQKGQFTPTRNGSLKKALAVYDKNGFQKKPYASCLKAAKQALSGVKTVKVNGKTKNMKGYCFFSRYVSGCRLKIGAHMFK